MFLRQTRGLGEYFTQNHIQNKWAKMEINKKRKRHIMLVPLKFLYPQ
jgi:hypothetical protein